MADRSFVIYILLLVSLIAYLFATAPPPLEEPRTQERTVGIDRVFALVAAENDAVRALWTKEIVGAGKKVGLEFDEHWRDEGLDAGPLPALFLREAAKSLEKNPVRLSLFLGSDNPINDSNRFDGVQLERFRFMKESREPQFFFAADTGLHTAMFVDVAAVEACIDCHNEHEKTPKTDWKLNDVMGATTWAYPAEAVSLGELIEIIEALHRAFEDAYSAYLAKVESFVNPPVVGDRWPRDGYFLPSADVFMTEAQRRSAPATLAAIVATAGRDTSAPLIKNAGAVP